MTTIPLHRDLFTDRILARNGAIEVRAFRHETGVEALEVSNGAGRVILLPFQGQQIWDATFQGRRLTMQTGFRAPQPTREYLRTYGAFFLHCGGTALGNPAPEDDHPLHGELPNAPYARADLHFGQDETGRYVELSGETLEPSAYGPYFAFRPRLRLHEGSSLFHLQVEAENVGPLPLPWFYMAHINYAPRPGARLTDQQGDDHQIHRRPPNAADPPEALAWYARLAQDPGLHRTVPDAASGVRDMVLTLAPGADAEGWSTARQSLGTEVDVVAWRPAELPLLVRWMARHPGFQALGFALPATARPDGKAQALRDGQAIWLAPGQTFSTRLRFGAEDR